MGLLDVLLPDRCAGCGREETAFCRRCRDRLVRLSGPLCGRCGAGVAWPVDRCQECVGRHLAFAHARAAVVYEGVAVEFVRCWKQRGRRGLARLAAEVVSDVIPRPAADAVVFVPAVRGRELWRGDNPSRRLASELSRRWSTPLVPLLARTSSPRPQRGLPLEARRRNVAGSFRPLAPAPPSVIVVDDVYTTGATVGAAAQALRKAGARRVEVVTFARAERGRGRR